MALQALTAPQSGDTAAHLAFPAATSDAFAGAIGDVRVDAVAAEALSFAALDAGDARTGLALIGTAVAPDG